MMMSIFTSVHKHRKPRAKEILRTGFYRLFQAEDYYSSAARRLCKTYIWCLVPSILHHSQNGCIYIFKSSAQLIWRFSVSYSNAWDFAGHLFCQYSKGCTHLSNLESVQQPQITALQCVMLLTLSNHHRTVYSNVLRVLALQQLAVCGDFLLQATFDVHEHSVLLVLTLHVASKFAQLLLNAGDEGLDLCQLCAVSSFCVSQVGFQSGFLKRNNVRTGQHTDLSHRGGVKAETRQRGRKGRAQQQ